MFSSSAATSFSLPPIVDPERPTTVSGIDHLVSDWVAKQLDIPGFGPSAGLGIVLGNELIAGVVYNNYRPDGDGTLEASIASTSPKWATRAVLRDVFAYPFIQMKVGRLGVTCRKSNRHARQFVTRLGFRMEGVARRLWEGKHDAVVYSMFPEECRWLTR